MRTSPPTRLLLGIAASALVVASCGSDETGAPADAATVDSESSAPADQTEPAEAGDCDPDGITLRTKYLSVGEPAVVAAKAVMEERYPGLSVETGASSAAAYDELTQQIVADIAGGRDLDVIMAGNSQVRFFVDTFAPEPLDTTKLRDTYDTKFLDVGTVGGEVYMAPFQVSIPALFYNKDLMVEAGLDPEQPPATFSELVDTAEALKDVSSAGAFYMPIDGIADWTVQAAVQSAGGTFVNDDGTAGFDTPEGREGIGLYKQMADAGLMDPISFSDGSTAFTTGATPLMITSVAGTAGFAATVGDAFEWGVVEMPVADGGSAAYPAGGNGWLVLTDDPCRAAFASELIGEMLAPEAIAEALKVSSYIPVDSEAKEILLADPSIPEQQLLGYNYTGPVTPWGGWPNDTAPEANKLVSDMTLQIMQGADLDSTIADTVAAIDQVVS